MISGSWLKDGWGTGPGPRAQGMEGWGGSAPKARARHRAILEP